MNGLLQLKGQFEKRGNESMGPTCLPAASKGDSNAYGTIDHAAFKGKGILDR